MNADSFAAAFDAIEVDRASAPSPAAIAAAMAMCAPADQPGFYLLEDCGGRFVVDREWGLISLRDESLLESERGQIYRARLRVVEPSGTAYELALRLRISGRVPQVVSEEDDETSSTPDLPALAWADYTATLGARAVSLDGGEQARFVLVSAHIPRLTKIEECDLRLLADPPSPAAASARWTM
ncbi:MAG: hypothetical protein ABL883_10120 [Terricaulis sp.]